MAIVVNAGPPDASSIIGEALSHYSAVATKRNMAPPLGGALPSLSEPVQVYVLPLENVQIGLQPADHGKAGRLALSCCNRGTADHRCPILRGSVLTLRTSAGSILGRS